MQDATPRLRHGIVQQGTCSRDKRMGRQGMSLPALVAFADTGQLPKSNLTNVKDGGLSPAMQGRFERAEAANDNSFVGLPLFAAAIVCPISCHNHHDTENLARRKHGSTPCHRTQHRCCFLPSIQGRFRLPLHQRRDRYVSTTHCDKAYIRWHGQGTNWCLARS